MSKSLIMSVTATAALGYAMARWLADASRFAERVERDEFCRDPESSDVPQVAASR